MLILHTPQILKYRDVPPRVQPEPGGTLPQNPNITSADATTQPGSKIHRCSPEGLQGVRGNTPPKQRCIYIYIYVYIYIYTGGCRSLCDESFHTRMDRACAPQPYSCQQSFGHVREQRQGGVYPPELRRRCTITWGGLTGAGRRRCTTGGGRPPPTYDDDVGGVDRGQSGATTYNWEA